MLNLQFNKEHLGQFSYLAGIQKSLSFSPRNQLKDDIAQVNLHNKINMSSFILLFPCVEF